MSTKMNALLAVADTQAKPFLAMMKDYVGFFGKKQGSFQGEKRTYDAKEGTVDEPGNRSNVLVSTTVNEKLNYFIKESNKYIDSQFGIEATNASGDAKAELIVGDKSWGVLSSLELLRLKGLLEKGDFVQMIENIPVRSDSEEWSRTENEQYKDRMIYESPLLEGVTKTTVKEHYILPDPNIKHLKNAGDYTPQVGTKNETMELGNYTHQRFSGMISHRERAKMLSKRGELLTAVIETLKSCNEVGSIQSNLTAERIFGHIFGS